MPKVVKFTYYHYNLRGLYACDLPGDQSGEYVPLAEYEALEALAEYEALEALVKRLVEIGPSLHAGSIANVIYGETANADKLQQLLADCRKALE